MPTDIWKFDDAIKLLGKRRQLVIHRIQSAVMFSV
jgi:hypothetical protein